MENKNTENIIKEEKDIKKNQEEKKEVKKEEKTEVKTEAKVDYTRLFFGLLIILLGVFYIGKNLDLWDINFNPIYIWPILLILAGILVMGSRLILRWIIVLMLVFIFVMMFSYLFYYVRTDKKLVETIDKTYHIPENMIYDRDFVKVKKSSVFESSQGVYDNFFSGNMNRLEAQIKVNEILDYIYRNNSNQRIDIEVNIKKIQ